MFSNWACQNTQILYCSVCSVYTPARTGLHPALMTSDVEHICICLFYLYMLIFISCLEKSIQILPPFLNWIVILLLNCMGSLYILYTSPLLDTWFVNIFSHLNHRVSQGSSGQNSKLQADSFSCGLVPESIPSTNWVVNFPISGKQLWCWGSTTLCVSMQRCYLFVFLFGLNG